jgi:hypothetical protein
MQQGEIGPDPIPPSCKFDLERLVSKNEDRPYRFGTCACIEGRNGNGKNHSGPIRSLGWTVGAHYDLFDPLQHPRDLHR